MSTLSVSSPLLPPPPAFILHNPKEINCVLFSTSDSNIIFVANRNGDLYIYDLILKQAIYSSSSSSSSSTKITQTKEQPILSILELHNFNLLTQNRSGDVLKWNKINDTNWSFECIYQKEIYSFCQFELSQDKQILFMPSKEESVIDCIEMTENKLINSLHPGLLSQSKAMKKGMLMNLKTIDDNYLLAGYENGELSLFDMRNNKREVGALDLFDGQPLMCFDYNKQANTGIAGSTEHLVKSFKLSSELLDNSSSFNIVNPGLNCIKIRKSDTKIFAMGGWDSRIRVYSVKKLKPLAALDFHKQAINSIDFSSGGLMAVGSSDCITSFWNLYQ